MILPYKTIVVKYDRKNKKEILKLLENVIESRLIFRNIDIEILYIEYIEGIFNIPDIMHIINNNEILELSILYDFKDKIKIIDDILYFKKGRRGGRVGRNGVTYKNKRNPYRISPE